MLQRQRNETCVYHVLCCSGEELYKELEANVRVMVVKGKQGKCTICLTFNTIIILNILTENVTAVVDQAILPFPPIHFHASDPSYTGKDFFRNRKDFLVIK